MDWKSKEEMHNLSISLITIPQRKGREDSPCADCESDGRLYFFKRSLSKNKISSRRILVIFENMCHLLLKLSITKLLGKELNK